MNKNIFYFAIFLVVSCQSKEVNLTEEVKSAMVLEIQTMFQEYFDAVRREGLTGEFKYLDHSNDFFWVPPSYTSPLSYDSVASILKLNAAGFREVSNSLDSLRVIPLAPDLAAYTAKVNSVMTDTAGVVTSLQLIETGVVIKREDGWKLLNGQTSLVE